MSEKAKPISILIVEDERIVARDLNFLLQDLGYVVAGITDNGEEAIQRVSVTRPNLVLMDIHLKGDMDGVEAAQRIRTQFGTPVVFLTAHYDEESVIRAKTTYPLGYITKPFDRRDLNITVQVALHKYVLDQKIRNEAQWFSTLLHSLGDGIIVTDVDGYISLLNPVAEQLTGWSSEEAVGLSASHVFKIINERTRKPVESPIDKALESRTKQRLPENTVLITKEGNEILIEDSVAPIFSAANPSIEEMDGQYVTGTVVVFREISHKVETQQKLTRQAFYDSLTNLPNRAWFRERLTDALERSKRCPETSFAVLLLDLDNFKRVNDGMGHDIGDRLLIAVGERLTSACRSIDTIARLGGDEFTVLLENIHGISEVERIVERIQTDISNPFNFNGQEFFTKASIGVVLNTPEQERYEAIDDLIRDADIAMYRAKSMGRGCHQIFDQKMRQKVILNSQIENDLRRILDREELVVYYQPIFCLETGHLEGFEALVRWNHPTQGIISPTDFLPIADDIGLGTHIDFWVLKTASQSILEWQNQFPKLPRLKLNVNISGKHFNQPEPLNWVSGFLSLSQFPAEQLNLEITENLLIENTDLAASVLTEMKQLGVLLSIDDFGTGYSSLSYLHQFPIDTIKIDRSFIEGMGRRDKGGLEIVRAVILLGQVLNIKTVAEGVETLDQLRTLQDLKCDSGQGYYFSKPLSQADTESFMTKMISINARNESLSLAQ